MTLNSVSSPRGALGYCFVEMTDEATAERCLRKINGKPLPGANPVWRTAVANNSLIFCLFIISEILFICWLIGLYFLIAHKIQVKPSDLWKTGKRVSPGGQAELSKVTGTVLMTEPSRSAALTLSLLVVGRCILCLSEISLQMWMMGCFMSFFTIVTLPVVVEKWYWTAWATPSKY